MILKKLFGTCVLAGLVLAVGTYTLGWDSLVTSVTAVRDQIRSAINYAKSEPQQAAEIAVQLERVSEAIIRGQKKLAEIAATLEEWREKQPRLEDELARQEEFLSRARTLLHTSKDSFLIGGRRYSREELSADAVARVNRCKSLKAQLQQTREQIEQLERALREGQAAVSQAQQEAQTLESRLAVMKTRIERVQLQEQMAKVVGRLRVSAQLDGAAAKLVERLDDLDVKLRAKELQIEQDAVSRQAGGLVDWENKRPAASDARALVDEWFDSQQDADVAGRVSADK